MNTHFGKIWDATPVVQTHTIRLTVSSRPVLPLVCGFLAGFLAALILFAVAQSGIDERSVDAGVFTHAGKAFKLVEMKP